MINKRATFKVNIEQMNDKWSSLLENLQEHRQEHHKRMPRSSDFEVVANISFHTKDNDKWQHHWHHGLSQYHDFFL